MLTVALSKKKINLLQAFCQDSLTNPSHYEQNWSENIKGKIKTGETSFWFELLVRVYVLRLKLKQTNKKKK